MVKPITNELGKREITAIILLKPVLVKRLMACVKITLWYMTLKIFFAHLKNYW